MRVKIGINDYPQSPGLRGHQLKIKKSKLKKLPGCENCLSMSFFNFDFLIFNWLAFEPTAMFRRLSGIHKQIQKPQ
jgi:hypothetical protein